MKTRFLLLVFALLVTTTACASGESPGTFHPPQTEAETALDRVLKIADEDEGDMLYFALNIPGQKKDFSYLFSEKLLQSWRKAEKEAVQETCNGFYVDGESCGLDYNPIICAQDIPEHYLYHTQTESAHEVLIASIWPQYIHDPQHQKAYRLIKNKAGAWVLDGVNCGEGEAFNMR